MGVKEYSKEDISKLINLAHKNITRIKGKDYAPDVHELQSWINDYVSNKEQKDTTESMGADSSGSFESALSGPIVKRKIDKIHNFESDIKEITDSSSSGSYDVSFSSGRSNPLKINGPKSILNSRAVKDKNFPKWGGPGGVYVKVKERCKKFPYCNQGDIKSLDFFEDTELKESVIRASKKLGLPYHEIEKIVINEINKIFIK